MSFNAVAFLEELIGQSPTEADEVLSPHDLPMEWRIDFEERAGILQFDAGLPREEADKRALREIVERLSQMEGR